MDRIGFVDTNGNIFMNNPSEIYANIRNKALEEAAKVCDNNAVIGNTPTATGYRAVLMETNAVEYNVAGVCYAAAIRALKTQEPE